MKVIAYGSLMNRESLARTLGRPVQLGRVRISGYQRVFNAPFDGYAYTNLEQKAGSSFEVAYFEMSEAEVPKFAVREAGSGLIEVRSGYHAFIWPREYCQDLPVLRSYLDFCTAASSEMGVDFWEGTVRPEVIIDDRATPLYAA